MKFITRLLSLSSFFIVSIFIISCAGKDINSSGPHEFNAGPVIDSSESVEELIVKANRYYEKESWSSAIKFFETAYRKEPYGRYSLYAKTKIADIYFKTEQYEEATNNYYDLVKSQLGNYDKEYAIYMTGLSNYKSFKGVGRDTSSIKKAVEFFDVILTDYPNSKYTLDAKKYKLECFRSLALREQEILEFYKKQGNEKAIRQREFDFNKNWRKYL